MAGTENERKWTEEDKKKFSWLSSIFDEDDIEDFLNNDEFRLAEIEAVIPAQLQAYSEADGPQGGGQRIDAATAALSVVKLESDHAMMSAASVQESFRDDKIVYQRVVTTNPSGAYSAKTSRPQLNIKLSSSAPETKDKLIDSQNAELWAISVLENWKKNPNQYLNLKSNNSLGQEALQYLYTYITMYNDFNKKNKQALLPMNQINFIPSNLGMKVKMSAGSFSQSLKSHSPEPEFSKKHALSLEYRETLLQEAKAYTPEERKESAAVTNYKYGHL